MKPLKQTQEEWDRINNWFEEKTGIKETTLHNQMNKVDEIKK